MKPRQQPLYESIKKDSTVVPKMKKVRYQRDEDESLETPVPNDISKKILKLAKEQVEDDSDDQEIDSGSESWDPEQDVDEDGYVKVGQEVEEDQEAGWAPGIKVTRKSDPPTHETESVSAELVELYSKMGKWMSTYRSGKVLKGLKMIPGLANWEEAVYMMDPLSWSPAAHFEAVKIFVSNLKPVPAQRYLNLVLLPAVRDDISQHKKLNFYYYESLKKALYKAPSFFKGVYLPIGLDRDTTVREAVIVGSVVSKMSIPLLHSAAALFRLAMVPASDWTPSLSILMSSLIGKRYALPLKVVEQLVNFFCSFSDVHFELPVVWHVGILTFVQIYKGELGTVSKGRLNDLLKVKGHKDIAVEIRREMDVEVMKAVVPMVL